MDNPIQGNNGTVWWKILLSIFGIWVFLAIVGSWLCPPVPKRAKLTICMSHIRQIGVATIMYAGDHQDKMPLLITTAQQAPYGKSWQDLLTLYVKSPKMFRCPSKEDRLTYSYDRKLSGVELSKATIRMNTISAKIPLIFESVNDSTENNNLNGVSQPFVNNLPLVGSYVQWPTNCNFRDLPDWARPNHGITRSGMAGYVPVVWADGHVTCSSSRK